MCISGVSLSCLYDITERQLHDNNARGINIQLHAHLLHINNCCGINCVIIPATMVYIYIYVLWSYYLGQVWPFEGLLSGPSKGYYLCQGDFRPIFIVVSGVFFANSAIILCFLGAQLSGNFLKIGAIIGYLKFLCCKLFWGFCSFFGLLKNTIK